MIWLCVYPLFLGNPEPFVKGIHGFVLGATYRTMRRAFDSGALRYVALVAVKAPPAPLADGTAPRAAANGEAGAAAAPAGVAAGADSGAARRAALSRPAPAPAPRWRPPKNPAGSKSGEGSAHLERDQA
jgi:hypothetical protein